jgi:hypothetical protein
VEWSCQTTKCSCYEGSTLCGNGNGTVAIDLHGMLEMISGNSLLRCSNVTHCEFHGNARDFA